MSMVLFRLSMFFCCNLARFLTVRPCDLSVSTLERGLRLEIGFGRTLRKLLLLLLTPLLAVLFNALKPDIALMFELFNVASRLRFAISLKLNANGL